MSRPRATRRGDGSTPTRPRASRERQRQRLIDACISALHVYGPSNTTVEKVVAIARMSPGIVRFYFDSKAAMLVASLEYLAAEFEDRLLVPVGALRSEPVAALERMVELYLGAEIASARKVSVWYSFWGEASSRQEYYDICGQRDTRFELLVRELIGRLIEETHALHLDADAVALGFIGVLEMLWQGFAFQTESTIDRAGAQRRALAYLGSVFPTLFASTHREAAAAVLPASAYSSAALVEAEREHVFRGRWQFAGVTGELADPGDFLTADGPGTRALLVRQASGAIRGFRNACPQRPHALATGHSGHLAGIDCVLHGLHYSLAGEPLAATPGGPLAELEVAAVGPLLFVRARVGPAPPRPHPAATAADGAGAFAAPAVVALEVAADWKLVVEHWLEQPAEGAVRVSDTLELAALAGATGWSAARQRALAAGAGPGLRSYVAPNLLIERPPGALVVVQALPVTAGRSRLVAFLYRERGGDRERALGFLALRLLRRRLGAEAALAASVQRGLEAGGTPAPPIGPVAEPLAEFRHMIARLLPGAPRPPGEPP